jgi:hypothetical protein
MTFSLQFIGYEFGRENNAQNFPSKQVGNMLKFLLKKWGIILKSFFKKWGIILKSTGEYY